MTLVTATVEDAAKRADNTVWYFSSVVLRESEGGGEIVTPRLVRYTPVAGVLSIDLEPGFNAVAYRGKEYVIEVPESGTPDLWDLLAASAAFPPGTPPSLVAQAVMSWLGSHIEESWNELGATETGRDLVAATDASDARSVINAEIAGTATSQAALARSLKAHLWVDVNAGVYQRDGANISLASAITHDTVAGRPYIDLFPDTVNDIHIAASGTTGVIGSGGALDTGWTLLNPSSATVTVERVSSGGTFDTEIYATIPPASYVGYSSPNISSATSTRAITFNLTAGATDLQYFETTVGWVTGTPSATITGGGGGQVTAEIAGSSVSTDKIQWRFKNTHATKSITVRVLVRNVGVYVPNPTGGLRRNIMPIALDTSTLFSRNATVTVANGDYLVFAWTEARGIVNERVTVSSGSFSLRTVIGNGRVTKLAIWKVADYVDGVIDVLQPPKWESVDEFDTAHLEMMSDSITSIAKMRYQAPGNPWNVQVAVNRFRRSRIESRPGEYLVIDTIAPVTYSRAYQRRAEVLSGQTVPYGTDVWTSFAFKTDTLLSDPDGYGIIWQYLDIQSGGELIKMSPCLNVQLRQNGNLGVYAYSTTDPNPATQPAIPLIWLGRYNVGAWNRIVMRSQFSHSGGGQLGIWLNGTAVYPFQSTALGTNNPANGLQAHYGFYGGQSRDTVVIDRANVEFGTQDLSARVTNPLPI